MGSVVLACFYVKIFSGYGRAGVEFSCLVLVVFFAGLKF